MVRYSLKILQHLLQDFQSVSDHFTTLQSKGLKQVTTFAESIDGKHSYLSIYTLGKQFA